MSDTGARALREAFDRSFADEAKPTLEGLEDLLMIRVGGDPYAIRLRDIGGIVAKRPIVPVAAMAQHFLGLSGVRGDVVPTYSLASILGHSSDTDAPAWMILCGDNPRIALAFTRFDGYVRLPLSRITADSDARANRLYVSDVVSTEGQVSSIIDVPRMVAALRKQTLKER